MLLRAVAIAVLLYVTMDAHAQRSREVIDLIDDTCLRVQERNTDLMSCTGSVMTRTISDTTQTTWFLLLEFPANYRHYVDPEKYALTADRPYQLKPYKVESAKKIGAIVYAVIELLRERKKIEHPDIYRIILKQYTYNRRYPGETWLVGEQKGRDGDVKWKTPK